ncbi:follistatin-related protein 5-like [Ptychodera flava]|uniref:follistatin-related protein 5-like n=1 Tax=Ptychodera flava TaxID=63121 RepID=UPI003969FA51
MLLRYTIWPIMALLSLFILHLVVVQAKTKLHFKKHNIQLPESDGLDQCRGVYCGNGLECQLSAKGQPECVCMSFCKQHHKPVCGSDGRRYENHCELHRASCIERKHITISHTKDCFYADDMCDKENYAVMKVQVLEHHMEEFSEHHGDTEDNALPQIDKKFAVSMMFGYYDTDNDQYLDSDELDMVANKARLKEISGVCTVLDLLRYDDNDSDKKIGIEEFYTAFDVSVVTLAEQSVYKTMDVVNGDQVSLKCDISSDSDVVITWKRNGVDLAEIPINGMTVNGALLTFSKVSTLHTGKYICSSDRSQVVTQTHLLRVQVPPKVEVCPLWQVALPYSSVSIQCHAFGIPAPQLTWKKNGIDVEPVNSGHITCEANNTGLYISNIQYDDTGSYECVASNNAGSQERIATVFVDDHRRARHHGPLDLYYVFHKYGIKVYDPKTCQISRSVLPTDYIAGEYDTVCKMENCSWSAAVQIDNKFIYATQPREKRVLIVSVITEQVIKVVEVSGTPVDVKYIKALDEVWVILIDSLQGNNSRLIEVITGASEVDQLMTIQTQRKGGHFQTLFLPSDNMILQDEFRYVYQTRKDEMSLMKIDVKSLNTVKDIDLSEYNCYPTSAAFVPNGGNIMIQCTGANSDDKQLILDYLTDTVVPEIEAVKGKLYVSPDTKYIVSVDNNTSNLGVHTVTHSGEIQATFDVQTNVFVHDIVFYPSENGPSYDIYASSYDNKDILFIDLLDGKVEMITDVSKSTSSDQPSWNDDQPFLHSSGQFGQYLLLSAESSLSIIDASMKKLHCEIGDVFQGNVVAWIGSC